MIPNQVYSNQIENLDKLNKLSDIDFTLNNIVTIENLNNLINLKSLSLSNNSLKTIQGLDNVITSYSIHYTKLYEIFLNSRQFVEIWPCY